jgi:hypothetical protein
MQSPGHQNIGHDFNNGALLDSVQKPDQIFTFRGPIGGDTEFAESLKSRAAYQERRDAPCGLGLG